MASTLPSSMFDVVAPTNIYDKSKETYTSEDYDKNVNYTSILDQHHLVFLDFDDENLKDKGNLNINWSYYNNDVLTYHSGKFSNDINGKCVYFSGNQGFYTNDEIDFNNMDYTIEFEVRPEIIDAYIGLFVSCKPWTTFVINKNYFYARYLPSQSGKIELASKEISANKCYYIAYQKSGDTISLIVNSLLVESKKVTTPLGSYDYSAGSFNIHMGMLRNENTLKFYRFFTGYMNKFAISDIARYDKEGNYIYPKKDSSTLVDDRQGVYNIRPF